MLVFASVDESKWHTYKCPHPTLLLDLVSHGRLGSNSPRSPKFLTGEGVKYGEIDVVKRAKVIGLGKCQGLIGLHNFTGAHWGRHHEEDMG